ncbi:hypothetical protein LZ012_11545 [Dechloromonas sp. XY25]|uniref:Uncharacterized protein n=1 Tax=Dechloromonas hankyongensis TaxID=2908002 RepID=A0ABS9K3B5_9RHOO|nr:hypothetical protein [Dechloromonas hankyongensis]MCG2577626.1 hypothetical protein [Dechloromonas hankyongensis]
MFAPGFVQICGNLFGPHRAIAFAIQIQLEDALHQTRLGLINGQSLFALTLVAELFRLDCLVAERRPRTVPVTLPSVLLHRPQSVLAVFLALVLIEDGEDFARHFAGRVIACLLGDRDQPHAHLFEIALIESELQSITEEARQAMHDDGFER